MTAYAPEVQCGADDEVRPTGIHSGPSVRTWKAPHPRQLAMSPSLDAGARERHDECTKRQVNWQRNRSMVDATNRAVEIALPDVVKRRIAIWPGMAAKIVQALRCDRIESRFCAPVHLLAVYERGLRHDGATFIKGFPNRRLMMLLGRQPICNPAAKHCARKRCRSPQT
jgi:hypothetical protein